MQEIIKEYGPALISIVAIIALVVIINAIMGNGTDSGIGKMFNSMIQKFTDNATKNMPNMDFTKPKAVLTGMMNLRMI